MKRILILIAVAAGLLVQSAGAAISVTSSGTGTLTFDTAPAATEWTTFSVGTSASAVTTVEALDATVQALSAGEIAWPLGTSATVPPSANATSRWNSAQQYLQTRPTGTTLTLLKAILQNDSGSDVSTITVSYTFGLDLASGSVPDESIPGHRVFYSLDGQPNSWVPVPGLSTGTPGTLLGVIELGNWPAGSPLYLLWADDNGPGSTTAPNVEGAYTIDNFSVVLGGQGVSITSPANGATFPVTTPITISADGVVPGGIQSIAFRANGVLIGSDNTSPYSFTWNNAPLGTNDLVAIATSSGGTSITSAVVRVIVRPNQAPTVSVINPAANSILIQSDVTVYASASDSDGSVAQVQFFDGTTLWGTDTTAPYSVTRAGVAPGVHTLVAIATDDKGLSVTSAPVSITVVAPVASIIPFGSTWKYLDTGVDLGADWVFPEFDDASWSSGPAELGYGDNDEATVVQSGPAGTNFVTTYFRKSFTLANPASVQTLGLRVRRDDGIIVYLNGQIIFSDNMTNEIFQVNYQTLALAAIEDDDILATNINVATDFPGLLQNNNVIAVEIHQAGLTSSDISFDLQLIANPGANAPVVTLTAPTNNATFTTPVSIAVAATAYDRDGAAFVTFYLDDTEIETPDFTTPYGRTAADVPAGTHIIKAVATDNTGLSATSQVQIVVLAGPIAVTMIQTNATWKYLDNGTDQGDAWRAPSFDDSAWASGPAELGYGDSDEATVLSFGPDDQNKYITYYFRHQFTVTGASDFTNLVVRLRRDDGGIVYLNGTEVFRSNMPEGPVTFTTLAGGNIGSETTLFPTNVNPALLVEGVNTIAVEVHQNIGTSSDLSFALDLVGTKPPGGSRPRLTITATSPTTATLSWSPNAAGFRLEQAPSVTGPWTTSPSQVNGQVISTSGTIRFYRLANP